MVTAPEIPRYKVKEVKGMVYGESIRTRGFLGRFAAGLEALADGRSYAYLRELKN
ncbi:MAG TPA: heavy metal-binding domain-containing protein [Thermofilum sp.]|nr:heavy metal-binding domain-containing protein [Thermofilum sp.]